MKINKVHSSVIFLVLISVAMLCRPVCADNTLTLAVHPYLSHEEVEKKFTPIAKHLSDVTGIDIKVRVGSSYEEHIQYTGEDKVDIAYMGPASYVGLMHKFGSKPILCKLEVNGRSYFQGNIVVRKDSGIKTLKELKGKRIAFGNPNSTMSYIVPHFMLHQAGVFANQSGKHEHLQSHNDVALGVLSGDFDAGAVKPEVFKKFEEQGLYTLEMTPKISEHLFVTRSNLPVKYIEKLRKAMFEMRYTSQGLAALQSIKKGITGLVAAKSSDYENLRKIIVETNKLD